MSILVDENTKVICQGITGSFGAIHTPRVLPLRDQARRRRYTRQGRQEGRQRAPDLRRRRAGGRSHRRRRDHDLRAPGLHRRRDPRGRRRRYPADLRHHRGRARSGHDPRPRGPRRAQQRIRHPHHPRRTELPRCHHARSQDRRRRIARRPIHQRRLQDRHHARLHPHPPRRRAVHHRQVRRHRLAVGHAHLRGRLAKPPTGDSRNRRASGIGGDPVRGLNHIDAIRLFPGRPGHRRHPHDRRDPAAPTRKLAAEFINANVTKPVAAFIAGRTAPPGKRMGHAGAIISGGQGTADSKIAALEAAGVAVAQSPADMGKAMTEAMGL